MYAVSSAFIAAQQAGEKPVVLAFLQSNMGRRVYGKEMPTPAHMGNAGGLVMYDGTASVGDGTIFGAANVVIEWGANVVSFGSIRETLSSEDTDVLIGFQGTEIPQISVVLDNTELDFSTILQEEDFLGQTLSLRMGFPSLGYGDFIQIFSGTVVHKNIDATSLTLTVDSGTFTALQETFYLGKSSRYANPEQDNELLPVVYGDCTVNHGTGTIKAVCIDTVHHYYLFADHPVLSEADGNMITVYQDGIEITTGFTVTTSGIDENGKTIAFLTFESDPEGEITVACQGKAHGADVIENPAVILQDLLDVMSVNDSVNASLFARAEQIAKVQGWKAAKVIREERSKASHIQNLVSSFLGDWWYNSENEIVLSFDFAAEQVSYNIAGILNDSLCSYDGLSDELNNVCNQPVAYYAPDAEDSMLGFHDGEDVKDMLSQQAYGVQTHEFTFEWVREENTINQLLEVLVERFGTPLRMLTVTENSFLNCHVERGDYVVAGYTVLFGDDGNPLKNQIWRVLEIEKDLDDFTIRYLLQDTGVFWPVAPIIYDGSYSIGGYAGRTRSLQNLW